MERQLELLYKVHREAKCVEDFHRGQVTRAKNMIIKAEGDLEVARVITVGKQEVLLIARKELDQASNTETKLKGGMDRMKVTLREHEDFVLVTERETKRAQKDREAFCVSSRTIWPGQRRGIRGVLLELRESGKGGCWTRSSPRPRSWKPIPGTRTPTSSRWSRSCLDFRDSD